MAKKIGAFDFLECSAKERTGVREVFQAATRAAYSKRKRKGSVLKSLKSSLSSISLASGGGGTAAEDPEKAKRKEEALAAKAKLKEEAEKDKARVKRMHAWRKENAKENALAAKAAKAKLKEQAEAEAATVKRIHAAESKHKARLKADAHEAAQAEADRLKEIAAAEKAKKVGWKQMYDAASPERKLEMKAEKKEQKWMRTATPLEVKMHLQRKAEAAAKKELEAKADAAAAAAKAAFLAGADASQHLQAAPAPAPSNPFGAPPPAVASPVTASFAANNPFNPFGAPPPVGGGGGNDEEVDDYDLLGDSDIDAAELAAFTSNPLRVSKYVAPHIKLGPPAAAAHGLAMFMGVSTELQGKMMTAKEKGIIYEFERFGNPEDKDNLKHVLAGTYRKDWGRSEAKSVTLEALLATEGAQTAKLERHHILALRLYTTSSYRCINNPLRQEPQPKQHPFAATALFIQDGIKKLRAVDATKADAIATKVYWRGMKDLALPKSFVEQGGAEFACMSTSADFQIAVKFAEVETSKSPLIFKYITDGFMNRGADISFLSVYTEEKEVLYPPLTYLKPVKVQKQQIKGKWFIVAHVTPRMSCPPSQHLPRCPFAPASFHSVFY